MATVRLRKNEPAGAAALLASRRFGPLFWAQFLSAFNDNAVKNALVLMIAYRADAAGQMSAQILIPLTEGFSASVWRTKVSDRGGGFDGARPRA